MITLFQSWLFWYIILSIVLVYRYLTRNFKHWTKQGINGPKPIPIFGTIHNRVIRPRAHTEMSWFNNYGLVYGLFNGSTPVLTVGDPEILKDILVKDFHLMSDKPDGRFTHPIIGRNLINVNGNDWKRIRSIASPTFTSGKMRRMYPMIKHCLNGLIEALDRCCRVANEFDAKKNFGNLTMEVIASCAFATKANCFDDLDNEFIRNAYRILTPPAYQVIQQFVLPRKVREMLKLHSYFDEEGSQFFFNLARSIIKRRQSDGSDNYNDFVSLLMSAQKSDSSSDAMVRDASDVNESHHLNEGKEELDSERQTFSSVSKFITEDEILAQAWIFFVAGYETTASTLTYASYELALNPEVQQKLYEEVMSAVDGSGDIDYDRLTRLQYLDAVVSETLRLHTPVVRVMRVAVQDYTIRKLGITLKKGEILEIPIYAIHHNPHFYPDPFKFDPERFLPCNRHRLIPYTYLPFVSGPRNCIGMRFGLMEAKLALARVVQRYRLLRNERTAVPLKLTRSIFNSPDSVTLGIELRNQE